MSFRCYDRTRGTKAQTTDELNQRFIVVRTRAVENNRGWTGKDGFQAARLDSEHTGGWQASTGW